MNVRHQYHLNQNQRDPKVVWPIPMSLADGKELELLLQNWRAMSRALISTQRRDARGRKMGVAHLK